MYLANFDGKISGSVGKAGKNDPKDVLAIRMLLNGFIASDARMKPLGTLDLAQTISQWRINGPRTSRANLPS